MREHHCCKPGLSITAAGFAPGLEFFSGALSAQTLPGDAKDPGEPYRSSLLPEVFLFPPGPKERRSGKCRLSNAFQVGFSRLERNRPFPAREEAARGARPNRTGLERFKPGPEWPSGGHV